MAARDLVPSILEAMPHDGTFITVGDLAKMMGLGHQLVARAVKLAPRSIISVKRSHLSPREIRLVPDLCRP